LAYSIKAITLQRQDALAFSAASGRDAAAETIDAVTVAESRIRCLMLRLHCQLKVKPVHYKLINSDVEAVVAIDTASDATKAEALFVDAEALALTGYSAHQELVVAAYDRVLKLDPNHPAAAERKVAWSTSARNLALTNMFQPLAAAFGPAVFDVLGQLGGAGAAAAQGWLSSSSSGTEEEEEEWGEEGGNISVPEAMEEAE